MNLSLGEEESSQELVYVVAAMRREVAPLLGRLRRVRSVDARVGVSRAGGVAGRVSGARLGWLPTDRPGAREVALLVAWFGMGASAAVGAAEWLLAQRTGEWRLPPPLLLGVAGALDPELAVGDIVAIDEVLCAARPWESLQCAPWPGETGAAAARRAAARSGVAVTAPRIVATAGDKEALWRSVDRAAGAVVDLESHAFVERLRQGGCRPGVLRAVSDAAEEDLPEVLEQASSAEGVRLSHLLWAAVRRPGSWRQLLTLQRTTRRAAEALAELVIESLQVRAAATEIRS